MKKYHSIIVILLIISALISRPHPVYPLDDVESVEASGNDSFTGTENLFEGLEESSEGLFEEREAQLVSLWNRMEAEEEAKWKNLEREVLQKWDTYQQTTRKIWVDYSDSRDAVSSVDFETGKLVVEAVVPESAVDPNKEGLRLITQKIEAMNIEGAGDGKPVMLDMLPEETIAAVAAIKEEEPTTVSEPLTVKEVELPDKNKGLKKTVLQGNLKPVIDPEPIIGKDGVVRIKVRLDLNLVPDHLKRRAGRYLDIIKKYTGSNGLETALVLAVIHSESFFNPRARSPVPAFGLMQLVPRFAAKEAYKQLRGVEKVLSPEYLYKPGNNIELGVTYLSRLHNVYFKGIIDSDNRRLVAISAYNWGPTVMRKRIVDREDINNMKPEELFKLLQQRVPDETRQYLNRVEERRKMYGGY